MATLSILPISDPDSFFSGEQQERLLELMSLWRFARDKGESLPPEQQAELDTLVETELKAATARTTRLIQQGNL